MTKSKEGTLENAVGYPAKTRKSPTYKLTIPQLTEQVKALETADLKAIAAEIARELLDRKVKLQKALAEIEGDKG